MRRTFRLLCACSVVLVACGDGGSQPAPPAGSHPLPSSQTPVPSTSRSGPMFAGPPRDINAIVRGGGGLIARMVEEDRRREEQQRGPERLDSEARRQAEGQRIAAQLTQGLTPSEEGPCMDLWEARRRAEEEQGVRLDERDRADWLRDCRRLPEAQRNCISPHYRREHQDECNEAMQQLSRRFARETGVDLEHPERSRGLESQLRD